jgi:hypothetical protein
MNNTEYYKTSVSYSGYHIFCCSVIFCVFCWCFQIFGSFFQDKIIVQPEGAKI